MELKKLCKVGDALNALSIGRTKFYNLVKSGDIEIVKIGSGTRVVVDSINKYVNTHTVKAS